MENITKFFKKNAILLWCIVGGILIVLVICGFFCKRHHFNRGFEGCGIENNRMHQGEKQWCVWWMENPGMMWQNGPQMWMGNPEMMWWPWEGEMQDFICQSWSLQSWFSEKVLIGIDMKINNLELIKNNIKSMVERTDTEYPTGDIESLDKLIERFDTQRKLLETTPESFCADKDTWENLNKDLRETMMSMVSGQVNKFQQEVKKWWMWIMRMFKR